MTRLANPANVLITYNIDGNVSVFLNGREILNKPESFGESLLTIQERGKALECQTATAYPVQLEFGRHSLYAILPMERIQSRWVLTRVLGRGERQNLRFLSIVSLIYYIDASSAFSWLR
jgi:hypothetical protein